MKTESRPLKIEERKKLLGFEEVFHIHFPRLKSFAFHLLHNESEAEDLVQEVFIQTWENLDSLSNQDNLAPYLFTLLKNRCLNKIKHEVVKRKYEYHQAYFESEELYHISFMGSTPFVSFQDELSQEIDKMISGLPPRCAEVFRLKWIEGKKHREISDMLDISMTMVDKHLARGLEFARKNLHPEILLVLLYFNS
jgi:RNA polymerase sigma-70 factor (family 1)